MAVYDWKNCGEAVRKMKRAIEEREKIHDDADISALMPTNALIHEAGQTVYEVYQSTDAMRAFAYAFVPPDSLREVDIIWDGIGEWMG